MPTSAQSFHIATQTHSDTVDLPLPASHLRRSRILTTNCFT